MSVAVAAPAQRGGGRRGAPLSPSAQALVDALVGQLEARLDDLVTTVAARVRDQVVELNGFNAGRVDAFVLRIAGVALRVMAEGTPATPDELVMLHAVGASRAAQALPIDAVLAGLRLGVRLGWNDILARIGELPLAEDNVAVLGTLGTRLFGFSDAAAAALAAGHGENRAGDRRRAQERVEVVEQLLGGGFLAEDDMVRRAAGFGYDLTAPHGLLLLAGASRGVVRSAAVALRRALPGAFAVAHRGAAPGHAVVLAPCACPGAWERAVDTARRVVVARGVWVITADPAARPVRLAAAYAEASGCVGLALAVHRRPRVVGCDDLLAHRALQGGAEDRRRFVERVLGEVLALPARHAEPLLDTLEGLVEHGGNVAATRLALGVHDKTIRYRIRRIRELTGLCPLRDRGRLELALMLHRLAGALEG